MSKFSDHRILLVNDDGIDAPGIAILERAALALTDDVWVVAPDDNRSGASHSLSIHAPIRVKQIDDRHFAVRGTPTECTMLGIHELIEGKKPTVVLSGINRGPNLAEDAAYSGTIAAAREATQLGIAAIAFSQVFAAGEKNFTVGEHRDIPWETSERWIGLVLERLLYAGIERGTFINVNFPGVAPDEVKGTKVTIQGQRPPGCYIPERRTDGRGAPYYWIMLSYEDGEAHPDSDLRAIADNLISITPMKLDLSALEAREALIGRLSVIE